LESNVEPLYLMLHKIPYCLIEALYYCHHSYIMYVLYTYGKLNILEVTQMKKQKHINFERIIKTCTFIDHLKRIQATKYPGYECFPLTT